MKKIIFGTIILTLIFTFAISVVFAGEKITLKIFSPDMIFAKVLEEVVGPEYEKETGVKVETEIFPYPNCHSKIMIELSSKSNSYDFFVADCPWAGEMMKSGGLLDLNRFMANPKLPKLNLDKLSSFSDQYCMVGDKRYGIVMSENTPELVYRKDLFEKYGIDDIKTWDDFYKAAKKLTLDLDGDGKIDIYGTVINMQEQDGGYSELTYRLMGFKAFEDGKYYILNEEGKPILNNSVTLRALEMLKSIKPYCPPSTLGYGYAEASTAYKLGKIAMIVSWQDQFKGIEDPNFSKVVGKNKYTILPYVEEDRPFQGEVGGFEIFMNKSSKNPEEAYKFLTWLAKGDAYLKFAEAGEPGVASLPFRNDPKMIEAHPYLGPWQNIEAGYILPVRFPEFTEIQRIGWEEISNYLADKKTAQDALDDAESRVYDLMKMAGYLKK